MSRKLALVILLGGAILLLALALFAASTKLKELDDSLSDVYAAEQVSLMIVEYIDLNDGRYPSSWNDLHPLLESVQRRTGASFTFDEIRERVTVDFEPPRPGNLQHHTFLSLNSNRSSMLQDPDPNERIRSRISPSKRPRNR